MSDVQKEAPSEQNPEERFRLFLATMGLVGHHLRNRFSESVDVPDGLEEVRRIISGVRQKLSDSMGSEKDELNRAEEVLGTVIREYQAAVIIAREFAGISELLAGYGFSQLDSGIQSQVRQSSKFSDILEELPELAKPRKLTIDSTLDCDAVKVLGGHMIYSIILQQVLKAIGKDGGENVTVKVEQKSDSKFIVMVFEDDAASNDKRSEDIESMGFLLQELLGGRIEVDGNIVKIYMPLAE